MASSRHRRRWFWLGLVAVNLGFLAALELGARAFVATEVGLRAFLYGTPWHRVEKKTEAKWVIPKSVQGHDNHVGRYAPYHPEGGGTYAKYFPHDEKVLRRFDGKKVTVRLNNLGFRGPDASEEKPPGVVRIATLGASSTFGYKDADDETYPHYLRQELPRRRPGQRFEVLNLGVPHATSYNLLALLLTEGIGYDPDVVTVYSGANDSAIFEEFWFRRGLGAHLILASFMRDALRAVLPASDYAWSAEFAQMRSDAFIQNLEALRQVCAEHGIRLIVASQQFQAGTVPAEERRGVTYRDEVELLERWRSEGKLRWKDNVLGRHFDGQRLMPIHARMMAALERWSSEQHVEYVDLIGVLDSRRDLILSWVHLAPDANRMIAAALADQILSPQQ